MQCCRPWWRNPVCLLDRAHHALVFKLKREVYLPGVNWVCDRHEHNMTGLSMGRLRWERHKRRASSVSSAGRCCCDDSRTLQPCGPCRCDDHEDCVASPSTGETNKQKGQQ